MRLVKTEFWGMVAAVLFGGIYIVCGSEGVARELHWQSPKKEQIRVRLVALAWDHPRSSFFASQEIFIAEKQLSQDESRLVILVYGFLPYQPRLSEYGLDYSTVHELRAVRDPGCDETLVHLTSGEVGDWRQAQPGLKYATDAPVLDLQRRHATLPCYQTTTEDYNRMIHEPASGEDR